MKIVTVQQMQDLERRSEAAGVSTHPLMENAGLAVAESARNLLGQAASVPILVLVGPGNNGGDGLVTARYLKDWGADVQVYLCNRHKTPDPKLDLVQRQGTSIMEAPKDKNYKRLGQLLVSSRLVIDAVLGTGKARPLEGELKEVCLRLAKAKEINPKLLVLALDLPTGLDADTGATDPACVSADLTVTLGCPKVGLFCFPGAENVGRLEVVDIGIPKGSDADVNLELMTPQWAGKTLPRRPLQAHKGSFGKALVVAGSKNYIGAAYLACTAATRVGAGLVTLATAQSLQSALATRMAEVTHLPLPETELGAVSDKGLPLVLDALPSYDALLVGCGLGQARTTEAFVDGLILSQTPLPPLVLDADALNVLAKHPRWWERAPAKAIITPHPGEMARLTGKSIKDIESNRFALAIKAAREWNKVVILKGAYSVVASPDGTAMVSPFANPGLASAGTGDVLAGTIVGLLAQGLEPFQAACLGVYLHGSAGEAVREDLGDAGMLASDLLPVLPKVIKGLKERN